jgi:hypothetical protein
MTDNTKPRRGMYPASHAAIALARTAADVPARLDVSPR